MDSQPATLPEHVNRRHDGLGICLTTDRLGRPIAYRVYRDRLQRCGRSEAELWVATEQARLLTLAQAREHWGPDCADRREHGDIMLAGLDALLSICRAHGWTGCEVQS